jgi:Carboxypeptidase regulatory-like domain/TonB dependent receptor
MGGVKMKIWKSAFLALTLVGMLIAAASAGAQNLQRGEIRGFVYDTSHALVPNAKVTIFNPSTGYKREFTTDAAGLYDFPQLLPGVYKIQAEAAGFATTEITDVNVDIGASLSLDITLPVKGQTQTVTVSAAATGPIDTSTAGINQVINQRNLETLPLSGRDYRDLAQLSSSAQVVPGLRGGIRLGGQQSDYLGFVVDGQDTFNNYFGEIFGSLETKNFTIPLDAVEEFQVVTDGFAPEFGRASGGMINVITKSGTNEWHGEAHEFYRGSSLTENDAVGEAPNISDQHQFGGSVGFPIHKDRQFLFIAEDTQREHGPLVTQFCPAGSGQGECIAALKSATGPTFADCVPGTCALTTVPLPGNLPNSGPDATFLPPACGTPVAGDSVLKDCYGESSLFGFNGASTQYQRLFTILGHYDYQFTPANHFSIRSYFTRNHTDGFSGSNGQNEIPQAFDNTENFINKGGAAVFSLNTVLGRKVNEVRISISDEVRERMPNSTAPQLSVTDPGVPDLAAGAGFAFGIGQRYYLPINNQDGKLEAADNFNYVFGKHDMKFGGDAVTFEDRKDSFVGWGSGEYDFFDLADFNNGQPAANNCNTVTFNCLLSQGVALNSLPLSYLGPATTLFPNYQSDLGLYWQDKWQLTPNLTVTYGLRWDGTWEPQPQTPLVGSKVLVGEGAGTHPAPVPQRWPADFNQWGPRIGVAWAARKGDHPTVVRGAWGLYYALPIAGIFTPTAGAGNLTHCIGGCLLPDGGEVGFPYLNANSTSLSASELLCPPPTVYGCPSPSSQGDYIDPKFENPRVSNLTASVEQTLARDLTLTVTYAFVHSTHLRTGGYPSEEAWSRNFTTCGGAGQPPAVDAFGRAILCGSLDGSLGSAGDTASFSYGNYHSIVVNVTKRFSRHFQVFGNYIWSQNKDDGSSERDTDTYFGAQDPFNPKLDYGRNGLDIKHQFKAAGVYELPWGFAVSSSLIAHTGVPYPVYINVDVNGDGVSNNGHNDDRPTITENGKTTLLGRYPLNQPGFAEWDARLQKDFKITERYHAILSGDFFNLSNRHNTYSNPDVTATIDYTGNCTPWATLFPGSGALGSSCTPLTGLPTVDQNGLPLRRITQVAPGSTPFAFQAGVKFVF